jgi:hypothetical protein
MPVWKWRVAPGSMDVIGTAGEVGATARRTADPPNADNTATSLTVPHVLQSGQRPTHLAAT